MCLSEDAFFKLIFTLIVTLFCEFGWAYSGSNRGFFAVVFNRNMDSGFASGPAVLFVFVSLESSNSVVMPRVWVND
jgi:hypothetical protein